MTPDLSDVLRNYPYMWSWRERLGMPCLEGRFGQRCRVVVRGGMSSAWIEFEDGYGGGGEPERAAEGEVRTRGVKRGEVDLRAYPRLREIVVRMLREILEDEQATPKEGDAA